MAATSSDLFDMMEHLDKVDKLDFQTAIDKANACTRARDLACTGLQLGKAAKLVNGSRDQQTLATARQNLLNERARIAEEFRLAEAARLKAEEDMRLAQEAEQQRIARAEQAEQDDRQSRTNMQGLLAIAGSVAIGSATSGKNFSDVQRRDLVDAWTRDRANAANGVTSNNFGQATDSVKAQLDVAKANAERARQANERMRLQEEQQQRESQAAALRQEQARLAQEVTRAAQERARLQAAQQARLAGTPSTTPRQQAALDAIAAARPVQQTVVIPTWDGGGRKTMEPVRTEPAALVASNLSVGQIGGNRCGQPGPVINECVNTPLTCPAGQSQVNGQCVTPTISCIAPAVLVQGRCVSPSTNAGKSGGNSNTNAPVQNQTRPVPVVPSPVSNTTAPAPDRPVPATTVSGPPEPAQPIAVEKRSFGDDGQLIYMRNISPRTTWFFALTISNCININETYCGRQVHKYSLAPGQFVSEPIYREDKTKYFYYEFSVELIQSY
jgi:dTMP kinase